VEGVVEVEVADTYPTMDGKSWYVVSECFTPCVTEGIA